MNQFDSTRPPLYILKEIAEILRSETGCPWDKEQTSKTLKSSLVEETYELYDAIEMENHDDIKEELGDLLYQIYAHSQIESELGNFTIDDVANGICNKLVNRHPHVFGNETAENSKKVLENWEQIKKKEKSQRKSILEGIPNYLPALQKAYRIQEKASRVGFDWKNYRDAAFKLDEELNEFKEAIREGNEKNLVEEAGDILFTIVNILRLKGIESEEALQLTNKKFSERFAKMEQECRETNKEMSQMSLQELDQLWERAKKNS